MNDLQGLHIAPVINEELFSLRGASCELPWPLPFWLSKTCMACAMQVCHCYQSSLHLLPPCTKPGLEYLQLECLTTMSQSEV